MDLEAVRDVRERMHEQVGRVVVGQTRPLDLMLVALLARGHVLLHGVPGVAKTLLARTFARALSLEFRRIQFTPDLMPGDVIGTNLFDFQSNSFTLTKGPIFTQVLLADEINRTPPKTQAALLQAMQERTVTIDGTTHDLGPAFFVVATQNPIEQEGTYPLPEAQLDRFLFKVDVGYPSREHEQAIVDAHGRTVTGRSLEDAHVEAVVRLEELEAIRRTIEEVRLGDEVRDYVVDVVRATRESPSLMYGASPRAAAMLAAATRALAALSGRDYVVPDDVKALAGPALAHRVLLGAGAEIEGATPGAVLRTIVEQVAAPR